jgi:hypothetical protein
MFLSLQVVTFDVFVFTGCYFWCFFLCWLNIKSYNLQRQKHQRLQPAKTKTSKVTTCKDKNIKGYNLQRQKHQWLQSVKTKTSMVTTCKHKKIKGYNLVFAGCILWCFCLYRLLLLLFLSLQVVTFDVFVFAGCNSWCFCLCRL